jgi:hypothetical protein
MRRFPIRGLLIFRPIDTLKKKGAAGIASLPWYTADMTNPTNPMSITDFARLGGKARAAARLLRKLARKAADRGRKLTTRNKQRPTPKNGDNLLASFFLNETMTADDKAVA